MNRDEKLHAGFANLLSYFEELIPLDAQERELITSQFKFRIYKKRQFVLQEGDICNYFSFVVNGCLRMYKIDAQGYLHMLHFATENWWITDIGSFHGRRPSELVIDAWEDTTVMQITYENLLVLYTSAPKFDRIFRVLIENSFSSLQSRLLQSIGSSAEERYLFFLDSYPHLSNRLPQTQIASFLGITPEFLSRVRSKKYKKS